MDSRGKFESRFFGFVQDLAKNKKKESYMKIEMDHDKKVFLNTLKKLFKVKYHPSLNKLSYGEIRRIYSALKKVG